MGTQIDSPSSDSLATAALAQAPIAILVFAPDESLTLMWRNGAHARMSASEHVAVVGKGMFHAFPPNSDGGDAAVAAIRSAVRTLQ